MTKHITPQEEKVAGKKGVKKRRWNYPRAGKGPVRRWIPSWRFVVGSFLTAMAVGVGLFVGLYVTTAVPDPDDFALAQSTTVYYSDGQTQLGRFEQVNRTTVKMKDIPKTMQNAVVASEDRTFYENNGVSPKAILRALINNLRGGATQGGSTLTQQYVERYYTGTTTSLFGKAKEAILAIKIDRSQTKEQILENYLNTIYFGRGAYGVEAASQAYFGIPASQMTLSQSAMLVGIIPAPSAWDPAKNPQRAKERFDRVIKLMVEDEWITPEEAKTAAFPATLDPSTRNSYNGTNGYLLAEVRKELVAKGGFKEDEIETNGYKIVTTINKDMQQGAVDAVGKLPKDRPANNYVGLYSMDPNNGEVLAMYGGADYLKRQRNTATQDRAQAGSTFKYFGLLAAIEKKIPLTETFPAPAKQWIPKLQINITNSGNVGYGYLDIIEMTKYSSNTGYVNLNERVGAENTLKMAHKLGLAEDTPGLDANFANVLGSASVTAKEMARAYGVSASGGKLVDPHVVREVTNRNGEVLYRGITDGMQVITTDQATLATYALQSVFSPAGTAEDVSLGKRPIAGKTGTSTGPVSAWFVGYTPQVVTAVDMFQSGANGAEEVLTPFGKVKTLFGSTFPAQIWEDYMKVAVDGMEIQDFPDATKLMQAQRPKVKKKDPTPAPTEPTQPAPTVDPNQQPNNAPAPAPAPAPTPTAPVQPGNGNGNGANGNGAGTGNGGQPGQGNGNK
ncbi:membrane peptidoglycan carboxypeptidase [Arcanobacterium pluranimalium]|uniref:transglycosylase domain-containing protein n=1 Tax=Arcanobacterium pluranimalium TaxID=108028 RepID=UPI00195BE776|nr:transglycosylase domain-containing protein [Arcanobacterium pluranimalium]MBM7824464.1 membrane peptidoglycan carboxypeptidase [Arcanobacterium pluranimalium]